MAVSILAIKFNHDTNAATHDALNLRIDASGTVNVPEWTGGETLASQSPEIQGPVLERTDVAGEVAFAAPGNTFIVGVRGNHVFMITNGGPELVDLSSIAATLDERLGDTLAV
jgi:hypothetical protein